MEHNLVHLARGAGTYPTDLGVHVFEPDNENHPQFLCPGDHQHPDGTRQITTRTVTSENVNVNVLCGCLTRRPEGHILGAVAAGNTLRFELGQLHRYVHDHKAWELIETIARTHTLLHLINQHTFLGLPAGLVRWLQQAQTDTRTYLRMVRTHHQNTLVPAIHQYLENQTNETTSALKHLRDQTDRQWLASYKPRDDLSLLDALSHNELAYLGTMFTDPIWWVWSYPTSQLNDRYVITVDAHSASLTQHTDGLSWHGELTPTETFSVTVGNPTETIRVACTFGDADPTIGYDPLQTARDCLDHEQDHVPLNLT